jgi:hypothetical protein
MDTLLHSAGWFRGPRKVKGDRLLRESSKRYWRIGMFCVLVLAACTPLVQEKASVESQPAFEAPTVPLGISINAVMVGLVGPPTVFGMLRRPERSPKTIKVGPKFSTTRYSWQQPEA